MSDSVVVLNSKANSGAIEAAIQDWLDSNSPGSIDFIDAILRGTDRVMVVIVYTSA